MPLRIVFAGTPEFAVPCLRAAHAQAEVVAVYTQPDRPAGRGKLLQASPVKVQAQAYGLPVHQPENFKKESDREVLRALRPDLMIVVAYGLILPSKVLAIPTYGCWNVHASLLPCWRGAAPIQRAIEAGDAETGVCLMRMEKGLDTGPVHLREATTITPEDTGGSLHDRLSAMGAVLVERGLQLLREGKLPDAQAQPQNGVTYARKLDKAEAVLDFSTPAPVLADKVRAFTPWPVCEARIEGERLRIHAARAMASSAHAAPGALVALGRDGLDIACGVGVLRITRLQREGGKVISAQDFANSRRT